MPDFILHIGTHKTGTTTLQQWCANHSDALAQHGILYPRAGRPGSGPRAGHHLVPWALLPNRKALPEEVWPQLEQECANSDLPRVLLSAEALSLLSRQQISKLKEFMPRGQVTVLIYLRHPRDYLIGAYKGRLQRGKNQMQFHEVVSQFRRCNYSAVLSRWAEVFGRDAVVPRIYDKVCQNTGLFADFLHQLRIDPSSVPQPKRRLGWLNRTPSEPMLRFLVQLNRSRLMSRLGPAEAVVRRPLWHLLTLLDAVDGGRFGALIGSGLPALVDEQSMSVLREHCHPGLEGLFGEWFPAEDRRWFDW